jgi:hypothetical protein
MFDEYEKEQKNFDEPTEEEAKRANALLIKTQFVLGPAPIEVSHFRYT